MDAFSEPTKWTTDKGTFAVIFFTAAIGSAYTVSQLRNGRWSLLTYMRVPKEHNEYTHFEQWRRQHA